MLNITQRNILIDRSAPTYRNLDAEARSKKQKKAARKKISTQTRIGELLADLELTR